MRRRWDRVSSEYLLKLDPFYNKRINDCEEFVPSESVFFNQLYIAPSNNNGSNILDQEIHDKISGRTKNIVICIKGYAGCGKSVYIQKIMHDLFPRNNNFLINTYDLKPKGYIHRLEIGAGTSLNDIESRYIDGITNRIVEGLLSDRELMSTFSSIVIDNHDALNYIDNAHVISSIFIPAMREYTTDDYVEYNELLEVTRTELKRHSAPILFAIDCLWRLAQNIKCFENGKKHLAKSLFYICFDNLDAIDDVKMCRSFIQGLCEFKTNLDECLYMLNRNHSEYHIQTFVFFITCRNVTWGRMQLSEFAEDDIAYGDEPHLLDYDISAFYEYVDIVDKRIQYFTKLGSGNIHADRILGEMKIVKELNVMRYVKERFKPLFNYNYRKCIEVIDYIIKKSRSSIEEAISLANHNADYEDDGIYSGSSSVFFRLVFDYFKDKKLFSKDCLDLIDLHSDYQQDSDNFLTLTTTARVLLQYFYKVNRFGNSDDMRLDKIFEYFSDIYSPSDICKVLYKLFVRNPAWRRPINFSKRPLKEHDEKADLEIQRQIYVAGGILDSNDFTQFEICSAGEEFIEFIVAHFEFFSCRLSTEDQYYPPLYTTKSFKYYDVEDKYEFEIISDAVLQAVEKCCIKLASFNTEFRTKKHLSLEKYLSEPIIQITRNGNPQLHEERIIFSHIFHLEAYRYYIINTQMIDLGEDARADINRRLVGIISRYIDLYNNYIVSQQRKSVANKLSSKIEIIRTKNYRDFVTRISAH